MTSPGVILILGAGPRVGSSVARKFHTQGFQVAVASRRVTNDSISPEGYLQVTVDLSQPSSVPGAFETVKRRFGVPPNVIVYNGALRQAHAPDDPFSLPVDVVRTAYTIGFESHYVAAQEALRGFAELPASTAKTFIFTGNLLNQVPLAPVFPFAVSKRAAAALIEYGANAYGPRGYRFYYADERQSPDGRPAANDLDGDAHGEMYWQLAQSGEQEKWLVTFTKDKGRVNYGAVNGDGTPYRAKY